jgi:hypothetical protein
MKVSVAIALSLQWRKLKSLVFVDREAEEGGER